MTTKAQTSMALVLSAIALVLWYALDAIFIGTQPMFTPGNFKGALAVLLCLGAFAMAAQYLLSRGHRRALLTDWPVVVTCNCALLFVSLISLIVEPNHVAAVEMLVAAVFALGCSFAGAALAQRLTHAL